MVHESRDNFICPYFLYGSGNFWAEGELGIVGGQRIVHDALAIHL